MDRSRIPAARPSYEAPRPTAELMLARIAVGQTLYGSSSAFARRMGEGITVCASASLTESPFPGSVPITRIPQGYAITVARGFRPEGQRVGREIPVEVYEIGAAGRLHHRDGSSGPGL